MSLNFTAQDILQMLCAILLFPTVLVFPGYVIGWFFDVFSFKRRTFLAQYVIAFALSNALIPIILFLAFRFGSSKFGIGIIIIFFISWVAIQINLARQHQLNWKISQRHKVAFAISCLWIIFCT